MSQCVTPAGAVYRGVKRIVRVLHLNLLNIANCDLVYNIGDKTYVGLKANSAAGIVSNVLKPSKSDDTNTLIFPPHFSLFALYVVGRAEI